MKKSIQEIQCNGSSKQLLKMVNQRKKKKDHVQLPKNCKQFFLTLFRSADAGIDYKGVVEKSSSVLIQMQLDSKLEVNIVSHELLKLNGHDVNGMEKDQVLDLSDEGERWEGDVLGNMPFGWGVLYDKEGVKAYEGFRIGNVSVCYGIQYYTDIGVKEYEGEIFEGKRWGRGKQYDRNGVVVFDGEWLNDEHEFEKRIVMNDETQFLHSCIEELIVNDGCCNGEEWSALDLSCLSRLRLFVVGDECLMNVKEVKLIGLNMLESVVIGKKSFTKHKDTDGVDPNRHFYLKDCQQLKELKMGRYSFSDFSVCEISNLASLEVIEMGELNEVGGNFKYASLELKSDDDEMK